MATATPIISRFHNLSDAALADEIGRVDSISKAAEAELKDRRAKRLAAALTRKRSATFSAPPSPASRSPRSPT